MRDRLVDKLDSEKYPVADIEVVEIGDDILEVVAQLVASAVDPNELNAVHQAAAILTLAWERHESKA